MRAISNLAGFLKNAYRCATRNPDIGDCATYRRKLSGAMRNIITNVNKDQNSSELDGASMIYNGSTAGKTHKKPYGGGGGGGGGGP